jgi:hypothetical protein
VSDERQERIERFLDSGPWQIAADRPQTRRAVAEFLAGQPDELLDKLFAETTVLVIAPAREQYTSAVQWAYKYNLPGQFVPFRFVVLDQRLENTPWPDARRSVFEVLAYAFARVAGLGEAEAWQIARQESRGGSSPS